MNSAFINDIYITMCSTLSPAFSHLAKFYIITNHLHLSQGMLHYYSALIEKCSFNDGLRTLGSVKIINHNSYVDGIIAFI